MDFSVFGIGLPEVFAILILLVVVVGPKRLPEMAWHIGRAVKTLQRYARAVRDEFGEEYQYLDEEIRTIKDDAREINAEMREVRAEVTENVEEVQTDFREATEPITDDMKVNGGESSSSVIPTPVNPVFHSQSDNTASSTSKVVDNEATVSQKPTPPRIF